ncbi:hypothetical protein BHE74_00012414 [Ensete ventricosum]|nr:hypothetical protein BHE74_00012414 [Ensete ventricosum]
MRIEVRWFWLQKVSSPVRIPVCLLGGAVWPTVSREGDATGGVERSLVSRRGTLRRRVIHAGPRVASSSAGGGGRCIRYVDTYPSKTEPPWPAPALLAGFVT